MAALAPFILVQLLVMAAVVSWPRLAHLGQLPAPAAAAPSEADVARRLREIAPPAGLLEIGPPKF